MNEFKHEAEQFWAAVDRRAAELIRQGIIPCYSQATGDCRRTAQPRLPSTRTGERVNPFDNCPFEHIGKRAWRLFKMTKRQLPLPPKQESSE